MPELPLNPRSRPPISWRAVLLGLLGVILICGLTPYNDYAMNNTFLVGNSLPLGAVMLAFVFTVGINGPLCRFAPRWALSSGEAAVAFSMVLVSCTLPSTGLMRYLPASLTAPIYYSAESPEFIGLYDQLKLAEWLLPSMSGQSIREWAGDPVVAGFHTRWTEPGPIPYSAWIRPAVTWGIMIFSLYALFLCLLTIVRRQWFENERLAFPLAQIQLALVEQPRPGSALNGVMGRQSFWVAFIVVFLLHTYNGLANYFPKEISRIPVDYDIQGLLSQPPWSYFDLKIQDNVVFFAAVGVTFFLPGALSFSLWFFFVFMNLVMVAKGIAVGDPIIHGRHDQHVAGIAAYMLIILWTGRQHWWLVLRQAFRGERPGEPVEPYLSYRTAFLGVCLFSGTFVAWLVCAGASLAGALVLALLLITLLIMITRIIAETGLIHGQLQASLTTPWMLLVWSGVTRPVSLGTYYLTAQFHSIFYDCREAMPVYASHGMKLLDATDPGRDRKTGRRYLAVLVLALLVGYVVSFVSTLWTEYSYDATLDTLAVAPINAWGARDNSRYQIMDSTVYYSHGRSPQMHDPPTHLATGFLTTLTLAILRWMFAWWPLHPLGYLMWLTFPIAHLWFSIMIGWLARGLILRFGGASLYARAKPFFIGLIVGESMAAGGWLAVGILLNAIGVPYRPVQIMPG